MKREKSITELKVERPRRAVNEIARFDAADLTNVLDFTRDLRELLQSRQRHFQQQNLLNPIVERFDLAIFGEAVGAVAGAGAG